MSDQGVPEMTPSAMKLAEPLSQMEARAKKLWDDCSNWPVGQFTHESWCRAYMEEALAKAYADGQRSMEPKIEAARREGYEAAAKWHEDQAGMWELTNQDEVNARVHRQCADAIRAAFDEKLKEASHE